MTRIMEPCDLCAGFGTVTLTHDSGAIGTGFFYSETCPDCEGMGEVEAQCVHCDGSLDERGYCSSCEEIGLTDAAVRAIPAGRAGRASPEPQGRLGHTATIAIAANHA